MDIETPLTRSIFVDVVGFTKARTVEDQTAIVAALNECAHAALATQTVNEDSVIALPTGDGLCVCLLNLGAPYDLPLLVATALLGEIATRNEGEKNERRRFDVRIGINENFDNVVVDFNGRRNIAGAGISTAQRVMSLADGGQILVSEAIFKIASPRERYFGKFREYTAQVKHGEPLKVYQYVEDGVRGMNIDVPSALRPKAAAAEPPLTEASARYFVLAEYFSDAIQARHRADSTAAFYVPVALALLAEDEASLAETPDYETPWQLTNGGDSIGKVLEHYGAQDSWMANLAKERVQGTVLRGLERCFAQGKDTLRLFGILSDAGREKLRRERPDLTEAIESGAWVPRVKR